MQYPYTRSFSVTEQLKTSVVKFFVMIWVGSTLAHYCHVVTLGLVLRACMLLMSSYQCHIRHRSGERKGGKEATEEELVFRQGVFFLFPADLSLFMRL